MVQVFRDFSRRIQKKAFNTLLKHLPDIQSQKVWTEKIFKSTKKAKNGQYIIIFSSSNVFFADGPRAISKNPKV